MGPRSTSAPQIQRRRATLELRCKPLMHRTRQSTVDKFRPGKRRRASGRGPVGFAGFEIIIVPHAGSINCRIILGQCQPKEPSRHRVSIGRPSLLRAQSRRGGSGPASHRRSSLAYSREQTQASGDVARTTRSPRLRKARRRPRLSRSGIPLTMRNIRLRLSRRLKRVS
jgi:hypothetical protein